MREKDDLRVPLVSLVKYKGILSFVRSIVGSSKEAKKERLQNKLQRL